MSLFGLFSFWYLWYNNFDFAQLWWPHEFLWESIVGCCSSRPSCNQISCTILIRVYVLIPSSRITLSDVNTAIIMLVLVSGTKRIRFFPKAILRTDPMDQKLHNLLWGVFPKSWPENYASILNWYCNLFILLLMKTLFSQHMVWNWFSSSALVLVAFQPLIGRRRQLKVLDSCWSTTKKVQNNDGILQQTN